MLKRNSAYSKPSRIQEQEQGENLRQPVLGDCRGCSAGQIRCTVEVVRDCRNQAVPQDRRSAEFVAEAK